MKKKRKWRIIREEFLGDDESEERSFGVFYQIMKPYLEELFSDAIGSIGVTNPILPVANTNAKDGETSES